MTILSSIRFSCVARILAILFGTVISPVQATDVSGTISASTSWTLSGSPYNLIGYTRVNYGATLTIDPGVQVIGNGKALQIFGTLSAVGNGSSRISLTNLLVTPGTNSPAQPFSIVTRYVRFLGGSLYAPTGEAIYGRLTLEDCVMENPTSYFYIWYPAGNCSIRRNVFSGQVPSYALFSVGSSGTNKIFIQDNAFYQTGVAVQNWASYSSSMTIVTGNNFLRPNFPTLVLPSGGYTDANMVATNNYWGTVDTSVINQMIFDKNDASDSANFISYVPFRTAPNPNAAHLPIPEIQVHPLSQSASVGDTVYLSVQATGLGDLAYQWQLNGSDLPAKTNSTLTLPNVALHQAGAYTVAVRNLEGTITNSQPATLSIQAVAPTVTIQPRNRVVAVGQPVTLTSAATGTPPLYFQWRLNDTNVFQATNSTLTFTPVQATNAGVYTVFVTNSGGNDTSQPANLDVRYVLFASNGQIVTTNIHRVTAPISVTLITGFSNGAVFYTVDGSEPSFQSLFYTGPFQITDTTTVRAIAYSADFLQSGLAPSTTVKFLGYFNLFVSTSGGGTVTVSPSTGPYLEDTMVNLTATPDAGWSFLQWLGDTDGMTPESGVNITRDKVLTAVFGTEFATTAAGSGSIALNPSAPLYPYGTVVHVTAIPQPGNYFGVWGNAATGNTNPLNFQITLPNQTVSSLFAPLGVNRVALTLIPNGDGTVSASPRANSYTAGDIVTLTAAPIPGGDFVGWTGDATGTQNPLIISLQQSRTVTANFTKLAHVSAKIFAEAAAPSGLRLSFDGEIGMPYRIDVSTNLTTWTELITITNSFGTTQFTDPSFHNHPFRFYRPVPQ